MGYAGLLDSRSGRRQAAPVVPPTSKRRGRPVSEYREAVACIVKGTVTQPSRLTSMDRIYLAIIASALLLLLGATGLYVTRTADLMPHARTVGFSGSR